MPSNVELENLEVSELIALVKKLMKENAQLRKQLDEVERSSKALCGSVLKGRFEEQPQEAWPQQESRQLSSKRDPCDQCQG